jgi:hypothetical protein
LRIRRRIGGCKVPIWLRSKEGMGTKYPTSVTLPEGAARSRIRALKNRLQASGARL